MVERNRAACRAGTIRANRERGQRRRSRLWLPTRWYAVFVDRQAVLNLPRRSRCELLRLFGVPPKNGRLPDGLPFVAVRGRDIDEQHPGCRRLSRVPADIKGIVATLLPARLILAPNPSGICQCGCGRVTSVSRSECPDISLGQHRRFILGHYQQWLRKNVNPNIGQKAQAKVLRIAEAAAKSVSELHWRDLLGPAFEASMTASRKLCKVDDIRLAARQAIKRHYAAERTYGHASVDYLTSVGQEPVDPRAAE